MEELQAYYRRSLQDRIVELEEAGEALDAVRRIAHRLKGTGASYGFPEITRAAERVLRSPDAGLAQSTAAMVEVLRAVAFGPDAGVSTILIVEDDAEMLRLLKAKLEGSNRRILTAETSAQASGILEREDIALVLLDLILPDEDGRNLLARLRGVPKYAGIPIIVVSARLGSQTKAECYSLGSDECFEKPVDLSALSAAVASKLLRAGEMLKRR